MAGTLAQVVPSPSRWRTGKPVCSVHRRHCDRGQHGLGVMRIARIAIQHSSFWNTMVKFQRAWVVFAQAEDAFREAIRLQPDDIVAYHKLAVVLSQQNQLPGAIAVLREAIRRNPSDDQSHGWLGESL